MANQLIHFGKVSLLYEDGFVRYVRVGEFEILRKIYFALRDSNWATANIVRSDERISVTVKGFDISYTATNTVEGKEVFRWNVKISGTESGEIDFLVDGIALASYTRNRAGICVLHPIRETKGMPVKITRPDGTIYESRFPSLIDPHQPFFDIRKMSWPINDKAWAELEFEGDIFETEDQRNWSDTSFKTYSTPLSVPYPVTLEPGDRVSQRVRMKLLNSETLSSSEVTEDIEVTIHENDSKPFPKIGADFPGTNASNIESGSLKALQFDHLRIELILSDASWKQKLQDGLKDADEMGTPVFLHLVIDKPAEVDQLSSMTVSKVAISPLDRKANVDAILQYVLPKIRDLFRGAQIGAGFRSFFTELNRNRFDYTHLDFIIYPVTPQAHATDSLTIVENLPAQEDAVISAKEFVPTKNVHVGLVTLKQKFNPDAKPGTKVTLDSEYDVRQQTPLAAGWMMASIKYLSEGGADCITLFESHGPAGFLTGDKLFPVYEAFRSLRNLNPVRVIGTACNEPLIITSLLVVDEKNRRQLILINHTSQKKFVTVRGILYALGDNEIQFVDAK